MHACFYKLWCKYKWYPSRYPDSLRQLVGFVNNGADFCISLRF